jgi:hypothetical protein
MPTRLVHLAYDAASPAALGRFWSALLDWPIADESGDEVAVAPAGFDYPGPGAIPMIFVPVPEPKTVQNRVHLDLASSDPEHQAALVRKARDLGATLADIGQGDVPWTVLADPEGNEFCVLEPREVYRDTGPVAAVLLGCADPAGLASFWATATGWPVVRSEDGLTGLREPGGTGPYLELLRVPGAKTAKNRLHPDLAPHQGEDPAAEVARLEQLGAVRADIGQGDVTWTVLADPEGSEFCVLSPR